MIKKYKMVQQISKHSKLSKKEAAKDLSIELHCKEYLRGLLQN